MKVKECKLTEPVSEDQDKDIVQTAKKLKSHSVRNIVICEDKKPIGIVSAVDIVNEIVATGKDPKSIKAKDIMTKPVFTCDIEDDVRKIYFEMVKRNIFVCPVTENGKLVGALPMHEAVCAIKSCAPKHGDN